MTAELLLFALHTANRTAAESGAQEDAPWCPSPHEMQGVEHALCATQWPGDVVYVPKMWWHATHNGDESVRGLRLRGCERLLCGFQFSPRCPLALVFSMTLLAPGGWDV